MSTGSTISSTVRHLMVDRDLNYTDLARQLKVTPAYLPRKIRAARWTVDELDALAEIFDLEPVDFVLGYQHIKEKQ